VAALAIAAEAAVDDFADAGLATTLALGGPVGAGLAAAFKAAVGTGLDAAAVEVPDTGFIGMFRDDEAG